MSNLLAIPALLTILAQLLTLKCFCLKIRQAKTQITKYIIHSHIFKNTYVINQAIW
jgi:hypothetical protein